MKLRHRPIGQDRSTARAKASEYKSAGDLPWQKGTGEKVRNLEWRAILKRTKEKTAEHNLSIVAAGVAFYIFLGLVPALGAVISIYGLASDPATIQQQVNSLSGFLPQDVIRILNEQMTRIAQQSAGATIGAILGILLALWSGAKAVKAVITALNIIYDEEETRGFVRLNATALGLTFAGTLGVIAAVAIIVAAPSLLKSIGLGEVASGIVSILRWPLLALLALIGFAMVYRFGPDRERTRTRWFNGGAVSATLLWMAISAGFSLYVAQFGNYNKTYGSLGAVVIMLMWFLLSAYVLLLGAQLDAEVARSRSK